MKYLISEIDDDACCEIPRYICNTRADAEELILALAEENIYYQAKEASNKDTSNVLNGLSKKDLLLIRYCLENNVTILKNKEVTMLRQIKLGKIPQMLMSQISSISSFKLIR